MRGSAATGRFARVDAPAAGAVELPIAPSGFFAERERIDGLTFQPPHGYWRSTYTPGDPMLRLLASKLADEGIEDQAQPYAQPFDAPRSSALAMTMTADRAAIDGPARVLLQVGLKGAPEFGRRRPTMNVALVVDAGGTLDVETAKAIRSVVLSFAAAKEAGDRMALFVAGRPGAKDVEPKRFDYGAVAVAMQEALADRPSDGEASTTTEALRRAIELVAGADDDTAPLGASAVLLIAHRPIGMELERIADMAHQSAVAGIVVSTIGAGTNVVLPELDRIALTGQGNRRLLSLAEEAEALVDRELSSVSRVVARAVRLRIRLAPGVKLVGVLGSRPLDAEESANTRQAERSIDLRLSKHLGIEADRGADEDGIQIVIPSYYANDEHPILLDLLVPGPGPIADAQVRYKDLVHLENGVARARLELRRGRTERGPLQLAVLKNLVSRRVSDALALASRQLAYGDVAGARSALASATALLAEVSQAFPQDREITRDVAMIDRYTEAIATPDRRLVDSMQLASKAKILPLPPSSDR
jgi:hypothetical protein